MGSSVDTALQHALYGTPLVNQQPRGDAQVLGLTPGLSPEDVVLLHEEAALLPFADKSLGSLTRSLALVPSSLRPDIRVLARAEIVRGSPVTQLVIVPLSVWEGLNADLDHLRRLMQRPLDVNAITNVPLTPVPVPSELLTYNRRQRIERLCQVLPDHDLQTGLGLLAALLHPLPLVIDNLPPLLAHRLLLLDGLLALLPAPARAQMTFNTHASRVRRDVLLHFDGVADDRTEVWRVDGTQIQLDGTLLAANPYVSYLASLWQGDLAAFVAQLDALEATAPALMAHRSLTDGLSAVAERHQRDEAVRSGFEVDVEDLLAVLEGAAPPTGDLYTLYIQRLFESVLEDRDQDAAEVLIARLDNDPELEARLLPVYTSALEEQPDAAYFFARSRLNNGDLDPDWLSRLHAAAENALDVAISSGPPDTIRDWLRLIAREPSAYELRDMLRTGLLAARDRALEDEALASDLLTLAVKRADDIVGRLLSDSDYLEALPRSVHAAVIDHDPVAIESQADQQRELFLLSIEAVIEAHIPALSATAMRSLWGLRRPATPISLTEPYRPDTLIRRLLTEDGTSLLSGAQETLLTLMLADGEDVLFKDMLASIPEQEQLTDLLTTAFQASGRSETDIITLVSNLITSDLLSPAQVAEIYVALLEAREWAPESEALAEQLARLLNQRPEVSVSTQVLWKMLAMAEATRSDLLGRTATRRLLDGMEEQPVEAQLVESVQRLRKSLGWSAPNRATLMSWWRSHTNRLPVAQLQKLERALEGQRPVDELRSVVQTALALRRMIGSKSLSEFAEEINTAYRVLQTIAEGFDVSGRALSVDVVTLRTMLESREDEIPPDERQVLATNLKELAQLLTTMAENRSKPSLIRGDDVVDRQLASGEQTPQSAIDVMKWLSGYLEGAQSDDDEES